jgi:hypothetical protein
MRILVPILTLAALAGCATAPRPAPPINPAEYRCERDWHAPDGRFFARATLAEDGRLKAYHLTWLRFGANWVMQFDFEGAGLPERGDDWSLTLTMNAGRPGGHDVRVDLLRGGAGGADVVVLPGPRIHADTWIISSWRQGAVRAAIADAPELIFRVTDRRGRVRMAPRIPAAVLDGPGQAAAERRAEIEAMLAGYRDRCEFVPAGPDIVVT